MSKVAKEHTVDHSDPVLPVPANAPPLNPDAFHMPTKCEKLWAYKDENGAPMCYIGRFPAADKEGQTKPQKDIRPFTVRLKGETLAWCMAGIADRRPLFELDRIANAPEDTPILIHEGEKAAQAGQILLPEYVSTTWMGGANATAKTNFSTVRDKDIILVPDCDAAGAEAMEKVTECLKGIGVKRLRILDIGAVGQRFIGEGKDIPKGFDIADLHEMGITAVALKDALQQHPDVFRDIAFDPAPVVESDPTQELPYGYEIDGGHLWKHVPEKQVGKKLIEAPMIRVASEIHVTGICRRADREAWSTVVAFNAPDGTPRKKLIPHSAFAGDGKEARLILASAGLNMGLSREAREALGAYITAPRRLPILETVEQPGWVEDTFILPDKAIGDDAANYFVDIQAPGHFYRQRGSAEEWKGLAAFAVGNSRLTFALCASFAGPLLEPLGVDPGGFHLSGFSSRGKTTTLMCAGSVWGGGGRYGFVDSWRTTDNGLETTATLHSDTLLCLDEIKLVSSKVVGEIIYMIGNGTGKKRANVDGSGRPSASWRAMLLSSGELTIAAKIAAERSNGSQETLTAGQAARVVDIPCNVHSEYGVFENIHGYPSSRAFANDLKRLARAHYGHAASEFLQKFCAQREDLIYRAKLHIEAFIARYCSKDDDEQILRVAQRFGLLSAAGSMATKLDVLPWPSGEAAQGVATCFKAWREERGSGASEENTALKKVREFIGLHGASRFQMLNPGPPDEASVLAAEDRIFNRMGYRQTDHQGRDIYYVFPSLFDSEICGDLNPRIVAETLQRNQMLLTDKGNRLQKTKRLPGEEKPMRMYAITNVFGVDDETD